MLMFALHCGHATSRRRLEAATEFIACGLGTAGGTKWRLGTVTRLRLHGGSVTNAVTAWGQRLLTAENGRAGQSGGHCGGLRCGIIETLAECRGVAAPFMRVAVAGEWLGDAGGGARI